MFMTLGFKSVTMDDIARELGISKKTIYQYYSNKTDLVEASTSTLFENVSCGIDGIMLTAKNSIEEVFLIREFIKKNVNEDASPFYQLQKFFPEIASSLRTRQFHKVHSCMVLNIHKGIDDGLFRNDIDVEFISRMYFTGLTGIKDQDIFPHSLYTMDEATVKFLEYHLRAIVTSKGQIILDQFISK